MQSERLRQIAPMFDAKLWTNILERVPGLELGPGEMPKFAMWSFLGTEVIIFGGLTALTILEVAVASIPLPKTAQIAALVVIAIIKAALVVLFYMHLRYDSKWYMLILLAGIFFALLLGRFLPLMLR